MSITDCICEERPCACTPEQLAAFERVTAKPCEWCGDPMVETDDYEPGRFCSRECDRSYWGLDGRSE